MTRLIIVSENINEILEMIPSETIRNWLGQCLMLLLGNLSTQILFCLFELVVFLSEIF